MAVGLVILKPGDSAEVPLEPMVRSGRMAIGPDADYAVCTVRRSELDALAKPPSVKGKKVSVRVFDGEVRVKL